VAEAPEFGECFVDLMARVDPHLEWLPFVEMAIFIGVDPEFPSPEMNIILSVMLSGSRAHLVRGRFGMSALMPDSPFGACTADVIVV
jgi:hypothetical protein